MCLQNLRDLQNLQERSLWWLAPVIQLGCSDIRSVVIIGVQIDLPLHREAPYPQKRLEVAHPGDLLHLLPGDLPAGQPHLPHLRGSQAKYWVIAWPPHSFSSSCQRCSSLATIVACCSVRWFGGLCTSCEFTAHQPLHRGEVHGLCERGCELPVMQWIVLGAKHMHVGSPCPHARCHETSPRICMRDIAPLKYGSKLLHVL